MQGKDPRTIHRASVLAGMVAAAIWLGPPPLDAATLEVGPGKRFARIEEANSRAAAGDVILIYPRDGGQPYEKTAIFVRQKGLTFRGVPGPEARWVKISGKGFDYSGSGSTPRAILQFNPGTDDCVVEGLELFAAHNNSHNGAGVRINQANRVRVRNCSIHNNDMGIMSNGNGSLNAGADQRIEFCEIHHNGDPSEPGYNHNLYLGGTSVTLSFCEVHHSLTGHNVKSRAHFTRVEYSYVHDSANREFDLVDAAETALPQSHAVLLGNIIAKDPRCPGNRGVIHFGQDGGKEHDGTLHLAFNTVVTPFIAPLVDLSAAKAKARWMGNLVSDGGARQAGQKALAARNGASAENASGTHNWFSGDFVAAGGLQAKGNLFQRAAYPLFADAPHHDYRLTSQAAKTARTKLSADQLEIPAAAGAELQQVQPLQWQYRHPQAKARRTDQRGLTLGAVAGD